MPDTPEQEFKSLSEKLKGAIETVERSRDSVMTEMKNLGDASKETKASADKAIAEMKSITDKVAEAEKKMVEAGDRIADLEQKAARRPGAGEAEVKSAGQAFVDDASVKAFLGTSAKRTLSGPVSVSMERKNITSGAATIGSTAMPNMSLVVPDRQPMLALPMRQFVMRDLITPGRTGSNAVYYPVQLTRTNNAAPVAEQATKPQSEMTFDNRIFPVQTLAHTFRAARQIMDDAPGLQSLIDAEARYGLEYKEEDQFLYGDGTGVNLTGIIPQASTYVAAFGVPGETAIDRLRLAILQSTLALFPASGIVLHQTDWAKVEMTKDGQGRYIVGNPVAQVAATLWGLPVASTMALTPGQFLVGAFRAGAQLFDRMEVEVLLSTEDQDNFVTNRITLRAEERLALVVKRPQAFVQGTLP